MKRYIRYTLNLSAFILSWLYPYQAIKYTRTLFFYKIYSFTVQRQFKHTGINLSVEPPLVLDGAKHIIIGNNVSIRGRCWISAYDQYLNYRYTPFLTIGDNVIINFNCHIACINTITIGNNVLMASNVFITDHFHGDPANRLTGALHRTQPLFSKGTVTIGDNVWLGENVVIMPNVHIGENTIIGANSVVTKDIPANCIAAGSPAIIIKQIL
jgi:serine acetyltransferase